MFYLVHVNGRRNPMSFERLSSADAYRRVMLAAGRFARITAGSPPEPAQEPTSSTPSTQPAR